jgi:hypothetical protein
MTSEQIIILTIIMAVAIMCLWWTMTQSCNIQISR